jgi:hypothetical protein
MQIEIVPLEPAHLDKLPFPEAVESRAYFSFGSEAWCVLSDGVPVFAGGFVNLQWSRAEAWIIPTPFLRQHLRLCLRMMRKALYEWPHGFRRVQATCCKGISSRLFQCLGFDYEGTMKCFGPNGETNEMWSSIFEVTP